MIELVNRCLIYPAYLKWNRDDRLKFLKEHERRQWLAPDEIRETQFRDFLSMLRYACTHVPFYRDKYRALGIDPRDVKNPEDLAALPMLTKKDVQEHLQALLSESCPVSQRYQDASGGSTGQPTIFYGDRESLADKYGAVLMTDQWTGWTIGEKSAYLWGADREANRIRGVKERLVQKYVYRSQLLNAFSMDEGDMESFAWSLMAAKPSLIVAYANAIYRFAQYLQSKGLSGISPKGIVSSAETLTEAKRALIEETFGCRVLNRYGSREVGLIASECPHRKGLHVNAANILVELQPVGEQGEEHRQIVVTDLKNRVMPLLRYNTGDLSTEVSGGCECGRGLPLIGSVTGRTSDFIVHPSGKLIHGEFFSHLFYGLPGLVQFQLVQTELDSIQIYVVVNGSFSSESERGIAEKVREAMGSEVKASICRVASIAVPSSGKYRFAISHVHSDSSTGPTR